MGPTSALQSWREMDAYDIWRMFFSWISKVFFANIEVIGKEHIPLEGPIVFVGASFSFSSSPSGIIQKQNVL